MIVVVVVVSVVAAVVVELPPEPLSSAAAFHFSVSGPAWRRPSARSACSAAWYPWPRSRVSEGLHPGPFRRSAARWALEIPAMTLCH